MVDQKADVITSKGKETGRVHRTRFVDERLDFQHPIRAETGRHQGDRQLLRNRYRLSESFSYGDIRDVEAAEVEPDEANRERKSNEQPAAIWQEVI